MIIAHILILLVTLFFIFKSDKLAFAWMRGSIQTMDMKMVHKYHGIVAAGLLGMIVTGYLMFSSRSARFLSNPAFMVKMLFVAFLAINAIAITFLMKIAGERTYASLSAKEKIPLVISGGISTVGWLGAIVCAMFL